MIRLLALFCSLLLHSPTWGNATATQVQPPRILTTEDTRVSLTHHISWLKDTDGSLSINEVARREDFIPLQSDLSAGFTSAAIWLRFDLQQTDRASSAWIIEIANALLDDVRIYAPQQDGRYAERRSGEDVPRAHWEIDYRAPAFHLQLDGTAPKRYYLRLWARNAVSAPVRIWHPDSFAASTRSEAFTDGIFYGVFCLILVLHIFFWFWTREKLAAWYVPYVAINFFGAAISAGYIQRLTGMSGMASDMLLGVMICMPLAISNTFALMQLELAKMMPRFTRIYLPSMWVVGCVTSALVLVGSYGTGVGIAQAAMLACILTLLPIATWLAWKGHRPARFFLFAFGIFYVAVLLRFLRNLGVLSPSFVTEYGVPISALFHMIVMSLGITGHYNQIKREKLAAQAKLTESLEQQVMERTATLVDEIARREASELEMRRALEVEIQAREEQQEFVAMVSHEFRTPLAIIDTVTQQLEANLDAPRRKTQQRCTNIRDATRRMSDMMDEYLSFDRLGSELQLTPTSVDPVHLVSVVAAEWQPHRLQVQCANVPASFVCDSSLLRIAMRNLINNAMRHSPQNVPVTLQVSGMENGGIEIAVTDEGEGVPDDEIPKLFQKYFRGRGAQSHPGAGLGLYLVERIAQLHGGTVRLESRPSLNRGSRFILSLPGSLVPHQR